MDPPHFDGRFRYDPPPPSQFLPSIYFPDDHRFPPPPPPPIRRHFSPPPPIRRHFSPPPAIRRHYSPTPEIHHHHRRPSPPPPLPLIHDHYRHHPLDHDRRFPIEQSFRLSHLHPDPSLFDPPPRPRVHDPLVDEPFRRELWDDRAVDVGKFRVFDQRTTNTIRADWEQRAPVPDYLPVEPSDSLAGRKRFRWDKDPEFDDRDSFRDHHHRQSCDFGFREVSSLAEQRHPPPPPMPSSNSYSEREVFDKSSVMGCCSPAIGTDRGYRESHYLENSKGKMILSAGFNQDFSTTPSRKKPSVLSRIHSGISVWDRIKEKPDFGASPSSPPRPALLVPPRNFSEEQEGRMDGLDLSYKSNALVAKIEHSLTSVVLSTEGKVSESRTPKKKVIKKKVMRKRTRVVVPIVTDGSEPKEGIYTSSPCKVSAHGEAPNKAIVPSAKGDITPENSREEGEIASGKEERPSGDSVGCEINNTSSQLGQQDFIMITSSDESAVEYSIRVENPVEAGSIKDIRKEECMTPGDKAGQSSSNSMTSNIGMPNDASSQIFTQRATEVMASLENIAADRSSETGALVENEIAEGPTKPAVLLVDDIENSVHSDIRLSMPSIKESTASLLEDNANSVASVGFASSPSTGDSLKGKSRKKQRMGEGKSRQLDIGMTTIGVEIIGGNSELGDPYLHSYVPDISPILPPKVTDMDLDQNHIDGVVDDEDHGLNFPGRDGPLVSTRLEQDPAVVSLGDCTGESMEQSYSYFPDIKCNKDEKTTSRGDPLSTSKSCIPIPGKAQVLSSHQPRKQTTVDLKVADEELLGRKSNISSVVPRNFPNRVSAARSRKEISHSGHNARNKTWHRNNTPSTSGSHVTVQLPSTAPIHRQSPKKLSRLHTSYVRKGNSLIRKSATEVCPPLQSHVRTAPSRTSTYSSKASMSVEAKADRTDHAARSNPAVERPKTPPLPLDTKLPHTMSEDLISEAGIETQVSMHENQVVDLFSGSFDNEGKKFEPTKTKRMVYVKHKSNQLVAAPGSEIGDLSTHPTEKTQTLPSTTSSDLYYKRKKNQLILSALFSDSQLKRDVLLSVDSLNSDDQRTSMLPSLTCNSRSLFKRRLDKVLRKAYKHPKFSRVWTLGGERWQKKGVTSLNRWNVLPHLFPWKRAVCWKNSTSNNLSTSSKQSLSFISRKLQITRKRDTIYKVSTDGFSLRKAGVLSIGGSSLKWSKSIERHSKKASEEATLAVAEVQRKKRERKRSTSGNSSKKNGSRLPRKSALGIELQQGERIFRVGSVRYKMDSSKRTLIRIPDRQASCGTDQESGNGNQIPFAPRRLLIGNNEYVSIGNGNKLVRDPKKLIRILASEKVRWSLHTARLRLARKQQYCQFFTRFGKCNKNGGKCPYIHDPSKVAICTKFLKGLCSNTDCKLTHKVLPERMPDCSYFLNGLCTNTNCPYRHVKVNSSAAVCEGFLRGYCADGDECRKQHSYVCPIFQATGKCAEGSKCKLHHPNLTNKPKKKKQCRIQSNILGRYFGSNIIEVGKPLVVASDKHDMEKDGDLFYSNGQFADYISLDVGSDNDIVETKALESHPTDWDSDPSHMQTDDLDLLIKPFRIMNKEGQLNKSFS